MATRRLKSDRFIAGQWNAETYTAEGLHWVQHNTSTYSDGQKGKSQHVVTTWCLAMTELAICSLYVLSQAYANPLTHF